MLQQNNILDGVSFMKALVLEHERHTNGRRRPDTVLTAADGKRGILSFNGKEKI